MSPKPLLILFVSTGNAARSQMAEVFLNSKENLYYRARSAGVAPLERLPFETKAVLETAGYNTEKLHPKSWQGFLAAAHYLPVDVIVTLSEEARQVCAVEWPDNPVCVHWHVEDPLSAERPDQQEWKFRKCMATLEARINALVKARPVSTQCETFLRFKEIGMIV
ncbi:MAG: hypothetical protein EOM37_08695 [Proteobacteria bacterium]|jgi:arsenate reductase|nr:hypothetical protein [Alphaproteobacteria bacterium]NCC04105.1 hypothetical protein [Pseudomonadota bacterium]